VSICGAIECEGAGCSAKDAVAGRTDELAWVKNGPSAPALPLTISASGSTLGTEAVDTLLATLNALNDPAAKASGSSCLTVVLRRGCNDSCGPCSNALRVWGLKVFVAFLFRGGGGFWKLERSLTPAPVTMSCGEGGGVLNNEQSEMRSDSEAGGAGSLNLSSRKLERKELWEGVALSVVTGCTVFAC